MGHFQRRLFNLRTSTNLLFATSIGVLLSLFLLQPTWAQAASSTWTIVSSPNASTVSLSNNELNGVAALSDTNVWTVGDYSSTTDNNVDHTLIEHWNGTAWSLITSPNAGTMSNQLLAVSGDSTSDVWAVGDFATSSTAEGNRTLIEHWNGTAWSVVNSPNASSEGDNLTGVAAISVSNVWAVGWFENNGESEILPLIEHWNGIVWSVVTRVPTNSDTTFLNAITAVSATDIWAVGKSFDGSGNQNNLAMHWNGTQWGISPSAIFTSGGQQTLASVTASSSQDVWAVGSFAPSTGENLQTLAVHWNGTKWSKVTTPDVDAFLNRLFGVAAISSTDVWAVGQAVTTNGLGLQTLIEQWNGTQWNIVSSPNKNPQGDNANSLLAVTASGPQTLWAVGSWDSLTQGNPGFRTLTEHTTQG